MRSERVSLDWDRISYQQAHDRIDSIDCSCVHSLTKIELYQSPTGKGYHCILWFSIPKNIFDIRKEFWDDPTRLEIDLKRAKLKKPLNILWHYKIIDGVKYERKHIETYKVKNGHVIQPDPKPNSKDYLGNYSRGLNLGRYFRFGKSSR